MHSDVPSGTFSSNDTISSPTAGSEHQLPLSFFTAAARDGLFIAGVLLYISALRLDLLPEIKSVTPRPTVQGNDAAFLLTQGGVRTVSESRRRQWRRKTLRSLRCVLTKYLGFYYDPRARRYVHHRPRLLR